MGYGLVYTATACLFCLLHHLLFRVRSIKQRKFTNDFPTIIKVILFNLVILHTQQKQATASVIAFSIVMMRNLYYGTHTRSTFKRKMLKTAKSAFKSNRVSWLVLSSRYTLIKSITPRLRCWISILLCWCVRASFRLRCVCTSPHTPRTPQCTCTRNTESVTLLSPHYHKMRHITNGFHVTFVICTVVIRIVHSIASISHIHTLFRQLLHFSQHFSRFSTACGIVIS